MLSKEEIEKAKEYLKSLKNPFDLSNRLKYSKAIETLLQYIDQIEQENNKQNEGSFEFKISEESAKKLHKMFEPLENAYNRFENREETLDDLLNYYPNFRIQIEYYDGRQIELDVVEKKYYKKLVDIINKLNKIIDEMAKEYATCITCLDYTCKKRDKNAKECIKQYFEKKVGEK